MGIISPTLCHKCMQHASECQEQWPLSLPSPGRRWGGASWEADRQTSSYSEARILEGGLTRSQATSNGTQTYGPCVNYVLGLRLLCTAHSLEGRHTAPPTPGRGKYSVMPPFHVFEVKALICRMDRFQHLNSLNFSDIHVVKLTVEVQDRQQKWAGLRVRHTDASAPRGLGLVWQLVFLILQI